MGWRDAFPTTLISAKRLGKRIVRGVIAAVEIKTMPARNGQAENEKVAITIKGEDVPFGANKGNCERLSKAFGDDEQKWVGKKIVIKSVPREYGGEPCMGLEMTPTK